MKRKETRLRRAKKTRSRIRLQGLHRLSVHKTPRHIYAQVTTPDGASVVTSASTLDKEIRGKTKQSGNAEAATIVGRTIAERAKKAGITAVAFDRSGFKYHGRVKALAEAARENGIKF